MRLHIIIGSLGFDVVPFYHLKYQFSNMKQLYLMFYLPHSTLIMSASQGQPPKPRPRIPRGACKPIFTFTRSLQKRVFRDKFRIHWFDGLPFRISTTYMVGSFTNIGYLWERINKGGKVGIFDLGACEVAWSLQARLTGLHGFYDRAAWWWLTR